MERTALARRVGQVAGAASTEGRGAFWADAPARRGCSPDENASGRRAPSVQGSSGLHRSTHRCVATCWIADASPTLVIVQSPGRTPTAHGSRFAIAHRTTSVESAAVFGSSCALMRLVARAQLLPWPEHRQPAADRHHAPAPWLPRRSGGWTRPASIRGPAPPPTGPQLPGRHYEAH
jgi:hypothetical protein